RRDHGQLSRPHAALPRRVQRRPARLHDVPARLAERPNGVLSRQRQAGRRAGHRCELVPTTRGGAVPLHVRGAGRRGGGRDQPGLRAPLPRGPRHRRDVFQRRAGPGTRLERRARPVPGERVVSVTVCLAPANTVAYPNGGGHLWVYLHWALGLKALGCRVIWLEALDLDDRDDSPAARRRRRGGAAAECVATLKARLEPYGLGDALALYAIGGEVVPD